MVFILPDKFIDYISKSEIIKKKCNKIKDGNKNTR